MLLCHLLYLSHTWKSYWPGKRHGKVIRLSKHHLYHRLCFASKKTVTKWLPRFLTESVTKPGQNCVFFIMLIWLSNVDAQSLMDSSVHNSTSRNEKKDAATVMFKSICCALDSVYTKSVHSTLIAGGKLEQKVAQLAMGSVGHALNQF